MIHDLAERRRRSNKLMAFGLVGVTLLILVGVAVVVTLRIEIGDQPLANDTGAYAASNLVR